MMSTVFAQPQTQSSHDLAAKARLLQLASQALPTGAYAYSVGLESMLHLGILRGEEDCCEYLCTLLENTLQRLELPLFLAMFDAITAGDRLEARRHSRYLMAARETREFQDQEAQMARALNRVLKSLCEESYATITPPETYSEGLAWAAQWFGLSRDDACVLVVYNWVEQQVSALSRLLPLGPLAGQRVLDAVLVRVPDVIAASKSISPQDIGASAPGLAIASGLHEVQYCRIFRS